jgi:hypothetical protein
MCLLGDMQVSSIDGSCQLCGHSAVVSFNYYSATPICEIDSEITFPYENWIVLHGLFYEGTLVEVGHYGLTQCKPVINSSLNLDTRVVQIFSSLLLSFLLLQSIVKRPLVY